MVDAKMVVHPACCKKHHSDSSIGRTIILGPWWWDVVSRISLLLYVTNLPHAPSNPEPSVSVCHMLPRYNSCRYSLLHKWQHTELRFTQTFGHRWRRLVIDFLGNVISKKPFKRLILLVLLRNHSHNERRITRPTEEIIGVGCWWGKQRRTPWLYWVRSCSSTSLSSWCTLLVWSSREDLHFLAERLLTLR